MNLTLRRSEFTTLSGIGEICDWGLSAHENQLTKFLKLLDPLFEDVLNAIDPWNPGAALQTSEGIRSQQSCARGRGDASGGNESFAIQRISGNQNRGSQARSKHGGRVLDRLRRRQWRRS